MVTLPVSSIFDDNVAEKLGHQLLPLDLRKAVPGIRGGGGDQIEHLDGVALIPKVGAAFLVKFTLGVTDDKTGPSGGALQDHVHTKSPCLFGAAGPIHRQITVEPGFQWDTDRLAIYLTQDDTRVLADVGNQVQHALQFLFGHKARCPICTLVGVDQVALPVICSCFAVPHPHNHEDQHTQRSHTAAHTVQAMRPAEHSGDAGEEIAVRKFRRGAEGPARRLPHIVVVEELRNIAAPIEQGGQGGE